MNEHELVTTDEESGQLTLDLAVPQSGKAVYVLCSEHAFEVPGAKMVTVGLTKGEAAETAVRLMRVLEEAGAPPYSALTTAWLINGVGSLPGTPAPLTWNEIVVWVEGMAKRGRAFADRLEETRWSEEEEVDRYEFLALGRWALRFARRFSTDATKLAERMRETQGHHGMSATTPDVLKEVDE